MVAMTCKEKKNKTGFDKNRKTDFVTLTKTTGNELLR